MSNRKNYNSIVFLTTLSVYLGLVLVGGATPSVLAQAATTRDYNIKNEVVVEDDLDENPDGCQSLEKLAAEKLLRARVENSPLLDLAAALRNIILLGEEIASPGFSYAYGAEPYVDLSHYRDVSFTSVVFRNGDRAQLSKEVGSIITLFEKKTGSKAFRFSFSYAKDEKALTTRATFLHDDDSTARRLAVAYAASLSFERCAAQNRPAAVILQNTEITFENNQVFIVTRLARASIDPLLAGK